MQTIAQRPRLSFASRRSVVARSSIVVRCQCVQLSRRDALLLGTASVLVVSPHAKAVEISKSNMKMLPVENLGAFQKADQRAEFIARAETAIKQYLSPEDSSALIRLALLDAGTYDAATKTGGATGAILASPPGDLRAVVDKLRKAKAAIDESDKNGSGPISNGDLIYLAAKTTTQALWSAEKVAKAGAVAAAQSKTEWPVTLGRTDAAPGPNKVPASDASVEEITAWLKALGAKPGSGGPFGAKPPFWEKPGFLVWTAGASDPAAEEARFAAASPVYEDIKRAYDRSRDTVSRTDYEVDFVAAFNKLTSLGPKLNPNAYLYPQAVFSPRL